MLYGSYGLVKQKVWVTFSLIFISCLISIFGLIYVALEASVCWAHSLFAGLWHCPVSSSEVGPAAGRSPA